MSVPPKDPLVQMARLAGEALEAVVEQEAQLLHLVQAEMDALGNLVLNPPRHPAPGTELPDEGEAAFDNMPV